VSDAQAVRQALTILRNQFPAEHPEITDTTVGVWQAGLQRFPSPLVIEAAVSYSAMVFPGLNQFVAHVMDTGRRLAEADAEARRQGGDDGVVCPECSNGSGMVEDASRQTSGYDVPVRPCSTCNFPGFWLWKGGHLGRDHTCDLCRRRRKNPDVLAEAIAADRSRQTAIPAGVAGDADF
jgi:hypothetical protein